MGTMGERHHTQYLWRRSLELETQSSIDTLWLLAPEERLCVFASYRDTAQYSPTRLLVVALYTFE